jgi:hypothetical protein
VQRVPAADLARAWHGLDGASRLSFLAAVWRARGFETRVVDGEVRADPDGTDGTSSVRIRPVSGVRRWPLGAIGWAVGEETPVAIVESADSGAPATDRTDGTATSQPRPGPARDDTPEGRLDAAAVRDLLLYGLDREDGERLAREYLDLSLTVPEDAGVDHPGTDEWDRTPGLAATVVVAIVIGAALAGGVGGFGFGTGVDGGGGDDEAGTGTTVGTGTDRAGGDGATVAGGPDGGGADASGGDDAAAGTPGALNPPGTPPPSGAAAVGRSDGDEPNPATYGRSAGYPPGIGPGGVVNLTALTAANEAALANGSFRLRVTATGYPPAGLVSGAPVRGPAGDYRGDGRWGNVSASVEVTNGTRAVERTTGQWFAAPDNEPIPIEYVGYAARGREWRQTTVVYAGGEDRVTETDVERVSASRTPAESVAALMAGWLRPYRSGMAEANVTRAANGSVRVRLTRTDRTVAVPRVYGVYFRVSPEGRLERGSVTAVREPGTDAGRTQLAFTLGDEPSSVTAPSVLSHLPPRRATTPRGSSPSRPDNGTHDAP